MYDELNRVTNSHFENFVSNPVAAWNLDYDYDAANNVIRRVDSFGGLTATVSSTYDATNLLRRESSGPAFVELSPPVVTKQCLFELDNGAGVTMRVQLNARDAVCARCGKSVARPFEFPPVLVWAGILLAGLFLPPSIMLMLGATMLLVAIVRHRGYQTAFATIAASFVGLGVLCLLPQQDIRRQMAISFFVDKLPSLAVLVAIGAGATFGKRWLAGGRDEN